MSAGACVCLWVRGVGVLDRSWLQKDVFHFCGENHERPYRENSTNK